MEDRLPRKLAAILYADVAGYSRLMGEDEDATHRTLSEYLDLISATIESHGGRVMHYAGDAVLAKFDAAVDALSAAVGVQNELKARNQDVANERKVQFRIGVNLGDVIEDRGDIYGDGVNVAARLESLAEPGGICISDAVRSAVGKKLDLGYEDMGEREVKNIADSVRVYRLTGGEMEKPAVNSSRSTKLGLPDKPAIAVLPLTNMSGDAEQEYFSDGITEDIITELSKTTDLLVMSRNSTFVYKGRSVDVQEVGKALSARYVLEGSVRKSSSRIRVNIQLIDARDGHHLWAERYDRELTDVFAVQDDIVQSVTGVLGGTHGKLDEITRARAMRKTTNLSAYDYFLRGREYMNRYRFKDEEFAKAREMLDKAIALDPEFSRAYLALAWFHWHHWHWGVGGDPDESLRVADDLAHKAERLEALDYWGHWIVGTIALGRREFGEARGHLRRALDANPGDAQVLAHIADSWCYLGQVAEAIELAKKAMRLNPNNPDWYPWNLAFAYFTDKRYGAALEVFKNQRANPESGRFLSAIYAKLGRLEAARAAASAYLRYNPSFSISQWAAKEPYADATVLEDYVDGLRKAGLPE
jgi:TolB-like protein/Flp pilus assembly protein TadD